MPGVQSGHQAAARRRAHGTASIMIGKAYSFRCQLVDVGCLDDFLSVATQVAVAKIIGEDVDDVGFTFVLLR